MTQERTYFHEYHLGPVRRKKMEWNGILLAITVCVHAQGWHPKITFTEITIKQIRFSIFIARPSYFGSTISPQLFLIQLFINEEIKSSFRIFAQIFLETSIF